MSDRWLIAWGLAAVAFGGTSLVVPLYVVELGGTAFDLGLLFASASFVGVPAALVFGNLADRTGRRRGFVLGALVIATVTTSVIPLLDSVLFVTVMNALLWFGFAAALPVLTLLAVAGEPESEWSRRIATLNRYQGIGWALGLAVGTVVIVGASTMVAPVVAQRVFFGACAISAAAGLLLGVRTLPPDSLVIPAAATRRRRRRLLTRPALSLRGASYPFAPGRFNPQGLHPRRFVQRFTPLLAIYFAVIFLVFTGFGVFFAPLPAYLAGVGFDGGAIFALYLVLNIGAAVCYGPAATIAERYDLVTVHAGGLLGRALALPAVAVAGGALGATLLGSITVGIVFTAVGVTWAVIAVTAGTLVTRLSPVAIRGEALGVYGALSAVGGGVGGLLGGWLAGVGYTVAFAVAGGLVVAGTVLLVVLVRESTPAETPQAESA